MDRFRPLGRLRLLAVASIAVVAAGACSSSSSSSSSSAPASSGASTTAGSSGGALTAATAATQQAEQGTNRPVDPTPRAAVKGKHVIVISGGEASSSSQIPSDAAVTAAKALGWQVELYDAKQDPVTNGPKLIRQAIAAGADGIILDAIDCQLAQAPLQEAKAKNIVIVPMYAFDCNDPHAGGGPTGYYSSQINFGVKANSDLGAFAASYGEDQANYVIAASQNKAKVIDIQDPEFTVLYYTLQGFDRVIKASGGATIVDTLNITASDILTNKLVPKIQAEILRHPEADWIKSPYTYATTLGIAPALGTRAGSLHVMGGEGFASELDLIRAGKVTAVNIISSEWTGWAAADTMNSLFAKQSPVDSGIGWTIADKDHNLPPSGEFTPPIDFKTSYKKAWGVS